MRKYLSTKGFSISLAFGSYGGFHAYVKKTHWRICLGWVALTIWFVDVENFISNLIIKSKSNHAV